MKSFTLEQQKLFIEMLQRYYNEGYASVCKSEYKIIDTNYEARETIRKAIDLLMMNTVGDCDKRREIVNLREFYSKNKHRG